MTRASQFVIESKHRQHHHFLANLKDFSYREVESVALDRIVDDPRVSLYCLDDEARQAVFVDGPAAMDLVRAPFVCRLQYEQARRIFTLPYEQLHRLAAHLPEVEHPIFVYTTGRSGSTLLHHAFNESQHVVSLSEPDAPTQLANLRHGTDGRRDVEICDLARSVTRFFFRAYPRDGLVTCAVKLRSHGTQVMDLFQLAFPRARNIFLYRQALAYVASGHRIYEKEGRVEFVSFEAWRARLEPSWGAVLSHLARYLERDDEPLSLVTELTLGWMASMEWYLAQVARGIPSLAVSYAALSQAREETLRRIFSYCDLPMSGIQPALRAYERDSQAGTPLARENPRKGNQRTLSAAQIATIKAMVGQHPALSDSIKEQNERSEEAEPSDLPSQPAPRRSQ